ncbi:MAG TPA: TolC family protein [Candidatus Hydrogenedentes bacterium]|nr:TolC family protein [Candidatus Hydrogenedentota bacterium]
MRSPWFTLVVVLLIAQGAALCDESSPTQPVLDTPPPGDQVRDAISTDLIDLSELRAAVERPAEHRALRLTLQEAIYLALANNPDIMIASIEPEKADAEKLAAQGEFDPILQQNLNYSDASISLDQQLRRFARISAIKSTNVSSETVLAGKLHTGTRYAVQFNMNFEETTFGGFQGEYGGQIGLTLTQPLLRGFGRDVNTIRIRAAGNLRNIADAQAELTILNKIADAVKAYWDLAGASETVRVYEGALRNAERLLNINEKRRDIGTAADIDVLQAKAGVAMRQSELIAAYARIADAGDALKLVLNIRDEGLFSKVVIIPTDRPNPESTPAFASADFDEMVENGEIAALEFRPEMRMTDLEIANAELETQRAKNEMLPQFDIVGSYVRGGRDQRFGKTLSGVLEEQDSTYGLGVQGAIIIGNRAARGAHQRARLNMRQAEERRKKTEMALMMGVHLAGRAVMTNKALMESNRQTVRLQEANVAAEEKRLQLGVTTSYQVLRLQEDLTAAHVQELQARIAYEKAVVDFQLATGTLLNELGIDHQRINDG